MPNDKPEGTKLRTSPILWSSLFMALALALTFFVASKEKVFVETNQIASPSVSLLPAVGYFFGVVAVMALVLFLIPLSKLRLIFRFLFALMFAWGVLVVITLTLSQVAAYILAAVAAIVWLLWARVWLHNAVLLITLSGAGAVFGFLFPPLTFMILMLIVAIYDIIAVRFGFMVWMADRLSESSTLPAFVFPKEMGDWATSLKNVRVGDLKDKEVDKREYAILGGGDIGFPLMLAVSVFFASNLTSAIVVGAFALLGLMSVFPIQSFWFKGKPMPALPPVALFSLIGFFIASKFLS
jgi:presenilin-like A22 family membrane protease